MTVVDGLFLPHDEQDEPSFDDVVSQILNAIVDRDRPKEVYVVRINNWFGHRWRTYPAGLGSLVYRMWYKSLRMPPFHPNRVKYQIHFRQTEAVELEYREHEAEPIHIPYPSKPAAIRYRPLRRLARSGVFLWYGTNSKSVHRASLMVYTVRENAERAWYASFLKRGDWRLASTWGISPRSVGLFALPS